MPALARLLPACAGLVLLAGCASWPESVHERAEGELADAHRIDSVPFFPQTEFHCGPAALATVLAQSGLDIDYDALVDRVYLPDRQGTLQAELRAATRQSGRIAYRLEPDPAAVLAEVAAGRPVLVLENHGLAMRPAWHYAVVIGFDVEGGHIIQHTGTKRAHELPARRWLRWWRRAGQWAMVALPPEQMPVDPDRQRWARALSDFEAAADPAEARIAWYNATEHWPEDPLVWLGLGNAEHALGEVEDAIEAFRKVIAIEPGHAAGRFNLALALEGAGHHCEAGAHFARLIDHPELGARARRQHTDTPECPIVINR